jgi:hypothetical protein
MSSVSLLGWRKTGPSDHKAAIAGHPQINPLFLIKHTSRLPIKFSKKFFKFKNPNFLQTLLYIIYITRMTHCLAYSKLHLNP